MATCFRHYDLLFRTSAETLLEVARNPLRLCAEIGFFSVLHTLESKARTSPACTLCRSCRRRFARSHSLGSLTKKLLSSQGGAAGSLPRQVRSSKPSVMVCSISKETWHSSLSLKSLPLGYGLCTDQYLGCYTHCVAISNHRPIYWVMGFCSLLWAESRQRKVAWPSANARQVLAPIPTAYPAARLRAHPQLRAATQEALAARAACWLAICSFIFCCISLGVGSAMWVATIQV